MTLYKYNSQVQPPAPFVYVTLENAADGNKLEDVPAQVDSAADRSVIPLSLIKVLGVAQMGTLTVGGFAGMTIAVPTFVVGLGIREFPIHIVKVLGADEPWVLVGRDVINAHRLLLDGPQSNLEIG